MIVHLFPTNEKAKKILNNKDEIECITVPKVGEHITFWGSKREEVTVWKVKHSVIFGMQMPNIYQPILYIK